MQFGPDEVEAADVLLRAMHFGPSTSPNTSADQKGNRQPFPSARMPTMTRQAKSDDHTTENSREGADAEGSSTGAAVGDNARQTTANNISSNGSNSNSRRNPAPQLAERSVRAAAAEARRTGGSQRVGADADADASEARRFGEGMAMYKSITAMNHERLAAEDAFGSMDQNSGRVSTPRFEELLTVLGIPEARRRGEATESARAAGLLSMYSFSRADFVAW